MVARIEQLKDLLGVYGSGFAEQEAAVCSITIVGGDIIGSDCSGLLGATVPHEGSFVTGEDTMFVYRGCGVIACEAVFGLEIGRDNTVLYAGRFRAACAGDTE